jgi:DNA-binding FadR family transcriptional regulator
VKRSSQKKGAPEVVAEALMARIFRGDYATGTHLPAERLLATQLGTDRTTLRMALKQLQRMNLVTAHHGSGIEVNDWRKTGGLDVIAALFSLEEVPLEGSFVVEALDFWLEVFSVTCAKAVLRMSLDDMREIESHMNAALEAPTDEALVEAELAIQDTFARLSGSTLFRMLNNSTRSVRARMTRALCKTTNVRAWLIGQKLLLRGAMLNRPAEATVHAGLLENLKQLTAPLREQLLFGGKRRGRR